MEKFFLIKANSIEKYKIVFIGESGGGNTKSNRNLPEIVIEEIHL
jgi:hypothetical protein